MDVIVSRRAGSTFGAGVGQPGRLARHRAVWRRLAPIAPVVDPVLCPVDGVLAFVLSVVRAAVRAVADAIATFLTKILFVVDPVRGVFYGVMPAFDSSVDAGRKNGLGNTQR
jgi:hypothetical protein